IMLDVGEEDEDQSTWVAIQKDGTPVGHMTHKAWSYRLDRMIGYALVAVEARAGDTVRVMRKGGAVDAALVALPFRI
ncbi:MAG: glycine cleavage T C-terminal barrel domain-containing protein, partial [Pseudomonadota bacterium]